MNGVHKGLVRPTLYKTPLMDVRPFIAKVPLEAVHLNEGKLVPAFPSQKMSAYVPECNYFAAKS